MEIIQRGSKYRISYRCHGYGRTITESFDSKEEAMLRATQVELEKRRGTLIPPKRLIDPNDNSELYRETITIEELLREHVELYGRTHWSASTLTDHVHNIEKYIVPNIGKIPIKILTTRRLEKFYMDLLQQPAIKFDGTEAEKCISHYTVEKIHALIRSALNQAIRWDYLRGVNPAMAVELPRQKKKQRDAWTETEAAQALQLCEDQHLKLCMLLAIGCSMRIGEILGLTWDCVHFSDSEEENSEPYIEVNKQLQRCLVSSVEELKIQGDSDILFQFPKFNERKAPNTMLTLKLPKTESSIRRIYLPGTVEAALREEQAKQQEIKELVKEAYDDFNLVICLENGHPIEDDRIRDRFNRLINEHHLRKVVFHSLRHSSTTIKLKLSHGDIKAVQGDTGHAQADMVTDVYSHITDADRVNLAKQMDQHFFGVLEETSAPLENSRTNDLVRLLKDSPELAETLWKMAEMMSGKI